MARTKLQTPNFRLSKRADGYYVIRWTDPATGDTKNKATGTKDAREAEDERARFVSEYSRPQLGKRPTVNDICDAYFAARKDKVASPESIEICLRSVRRLLGPLYADKLGQDVIDNYADDRLEEVPERSPKYRGPAGPVSEATVNKELRILRAALNWAVKAQHLDRAPGFTIDLSSGDARIHWLDRGDILALLKAASPHVALFIRLAVVTARRRGAILDLTWDNVDLSRQGYEQIDFGEAVGNKNRGVVGISGAKPLIEHLREAKEIAKTPYVIEYRGEGVSDIKTALHATCRRAGLPPIGTHILKHTSVTWMLGAGKSFDQIAKFTQTSVEILERNYSHLNITAVQSITEALSI